MTKSKTWEIRIDREIVLSAQGTEAFLAKCREQEVVLDTTRQGNTIGRFPDGRVGTVRVR